MKAIIGLGNPGTEYERTRHNVGFLVLDALAQQYSGTFTAKRSLEALIAEVMIDGERVLLVKPQTFMNVSGRTVNGVRSKYPISSEDLLVIYDDADLPFLDVRLKEAGGSAGHRGMESILATVPKGTPVARIRVGIGRPPHSDVPLDQFVLGRWTESETKHLPDITARSSEIISAWIATSARHTPSPRSEETTL